MARVKCSRCDRYYSGMHLKCPYCGAHRSKKTVRKEQEEMSNTKFVIGGIVLIALIAAVVVLIIISMSGGNKPADDKVVDDTPEYVQDEGVDSIEGSTSENDITGEDVTSQDGTTPDDTTNDPIIDDQTQGELVINSVKITLNGGERTDVTVYIGDVYDFDFETDPVTTDETATWTSDDESVAVVLQNGEVSIVGEGTTFINCTVGGKTGSMLVRAKA